MRTGTRITGSYDELEDRLKLAILDQDQNPLALWLTQRMANRLIKALVKLLDKQVTPEAAPKQRQSVQYFQQASAEMTMSPSQPVEAPPDTLLGIITTINIKHGDDKVVIEFVCGEDEGVNLPMAMTPLRQIMRVFYRLYEKAEWHRDDVWPEWFQDDAHQEVLSPNQVN